jgi:hypothetical protein
MVLLSGVIIVWRMIAYADSESIFEAFTLFVFILVFTGTFLFNLVRDSKNFKLSKKSVAYSSTCIGVFCVLVMIVTQLSLMSRDSSPVILHVSNDGGFNGCGFEFREDGTYRFFNGSALGVDYFRGTYVLTDTIITLDKTEIDGCTKSNQLAIRGDVLYQIDDRHDIIERTLDFIIREDGRQKLHQ